MAPTLLFDISAIDLSRIQFDAAAIEQVNPHRGHMRQIDGIHLMADDLSYAVGYKDVRDDEFWVPGHIPGRPLLPGVLMIEAAAQLASFVTIKRLGEARFLGFIGADEVKFRGQVSPGSRLLLLVKELKFSKRRFVSAAQGLVDGSLVFEGKISGMAI